MEDVPWGDDCHHMSNATQAGVSTFLGPSVKFLWHVSIMAQNFYSISLVYNHPWLKDVPWGVDCHHKVKVTGRGQHTFIAQC